jgi:O-antigen/teichoic acid export membrane protein
MSKALKVTFGVHAVVALLFGAPLLIAPGRFLGVFGWAPIDPLISRLLGAAMLALAWSSFLGYRTTESSLEKSFIQIEVVYTVLGAIGLLRHLLVAWYAWFVWAIFYLLAIFAILWIYFWWKKR